MKVSSGLICLRIDRGEPFYEEVGGYFGASVSSRGCVVPTEQGQMVFMNRKQWDDFEAKFDLETPSCLKDAQ